MGLCDDELMADWMDRNFDVGLAHLPDGSRPKTGGVYLIIITNLKKSLKFKKVFKFKKVVKNFNF